MDASELNAILRELPNLGEEQVRVLHATWEGGDVSLRTRAWQHGKHIVTDRHLERALTGATDQVQRWARDYSTGRSAAPNAMDASFVDVQRLDLRVAAAPAVLDALLGTLVGDQLDLDEVEELLRPWQEATAPPAPVGADWSGASRDPELQTPRG
jgi:hypothetical protein